MLNWTWAQGEPVATEYQGCSGNPETPEDSEYSEPKSRIWPHNFHISPDCVPHMERTSSRSKERDLWSETDGWLQGSRCEHSYVVYIYVCYTSSCSSSWTRLFAKHTIYHESTFKVCGSVISDNWDIDQRSDGDRRFVHDWLESANVERIISIVW